MAAATDGPVPFSECAMWARQASFYASAGPQSWLTGTVPYWATSNAFVADRAAAVLAAAIEDASKGGRVDASEPVVVVELGAGLGAFTWLLLPRLRARLLRARLPPVLYVMTDLDDRMLDAWAEPHSGFARIPAPPVPGAPWPALTLNFAVVDAAAAPASPAVLRLRRRGADAALPSRLHASPLFVVANYVLDSLPTDAFRVVGGELSEERVLLAPHAHAADADADGTWLARADLAWTLVPLATADGRYSAARGHGPPALCAALNDALRWYCAALALRAVSFVRDPAVARTRRSSASKSRSSSDGTGDERARAERAWSEGTDDEDACDERARVATESASVLMPLAGLRALHALAQWSTRGAVVRGRGGGRSKGSEGAHVASEGGEGAHVIAPLAPLASAGPGLRQRQRRRGRVPRHGLAPCGPPRVGVGDGELPRARARGGAHGRVAGAAAARGRGPQRGGGPLASGRRRAERGRRRRH
jgi:hypothetical protein